MTTDDSYELYTEAGNLLAARRVAEIVSDIQEDNLTRKQAIARVQAAIEEIKLLDDGMYDSEPRYAIWHRINKAFREAGWMAYEF